MEGMEGMEVSRLYHKRDLANSRNFLFHLTLPSFTLHPGHYTRE